MSEDRPRHKPKWQDPEITDFTEQSKRPKYYYQQHCGLPQQNCSRPVENGYIAGRMCYPPDAVWISNPYCRPNGFNYGYGWLRH